MGKIFWLASYPKSGNTWLRVFLRNLANSKGPADINHLGSQFPYDVGVTWYQQIDPRPSPDYTHQQVIEMRPRVQKLIADSAPGIVFAKTHSALIIENGYPAINPEVTVGAIYLVRNPLDVAVSYSFHLGRSIDAAIEIMNMNAATTGPEEGRVFEHMGSWSENVESWTRSNPRIHVARYEDLIARPVKTFTGIARALGFDPTRDTVERALKFSSLRVLQEQERTRGFVEHPSTASAPFFRAGKIGDGKKLLTPMQIDRIASAHVTQMERFGYLP